MGILIGVMGLYVLGWVVVRDIVEKKLSTSLVWIEPDPVEYFTILNRTRANELEELEDRFDNGTKAWAIVSKDNKLYFGDAGNVWIYKSKRSAKKYCDKEDGESVKKVKIILDY